MGRCCDGGRRCDRKRHGGRLLGNRIRPLAVGRRTGLPRIEHFAICRGLFVASAAEFLKVSWQPMILGNWDGPLMACFGRAAAPPAARAGMARVSNGAPATTNESLRVRRWASRFSRARRAGIVWLDRHGLAYRTLSQVITARISGATAPWGCLEPTRDQGRPARFIDDQSHDDRSGRDIMLYRHASFSSQ
jgi:hypothetical protein